MHIRSFYVCVSDVWIATCVFFLRFRPVPTLALCVYMAGYVFEMPYSLSAFKTLPARIFTHSIHVLE